MYDLFIFDLDGTLIDSIGDITDALNRMLAEYGHAPLTDGAVIRIVGGGVEELVRRALGPGHETQISAAARRYLELYTEQPVARTSLYLGVKETLRALAPAQKAVATNKPGELARTILKKLGIADEFIAILGEDDVGRRKPDPLVVDIIRGKAGASRARTLYVGDSLVDAETARAARVDLCLCTYGYADPEQIRRHPATLHIDRFTDLWTHSRG